MSECGVGGAGAVQGQGLGKLGTCSLEMGNGERGSVGTGKEAQWEQGNGLIRNGEWAYEE